VSRHASESVEASIRNAIQQGRAKQSELDCVKGANLDFTVDVYAKAIAAALSAEEIKQGVAFFSSPEGQGYLQYSRSLELKARGVPDSTPKADLNPAEYAATTGFLGKSAGKKLLEDRVLETPELRSNLARAMSGLIQKCRS
jgi:hypothetical protein